MEVWDLLHAVSRGRRRRASPAVAAAALTLAVLIARFAPGVLDAIAESSTQHLADKVIAVVEGHTQQLTDRLQPTNTTIAEEEDHG